MTRRIEANCESSQRIMLDEMLNDVTLQCIPLMDSSQHSMGGDPLLSGVPTYPATSLPGFGDAFADHYTNHSQSSDSGLGAIGQLVHDTTSSVSNLDLLVNTSQQQHLSSTSSANSNNTNRQISSLQNHQHHNYQIQQNSYNTATSANSASRSGNGSTRYRRQQNQQQQQQQHTGYSRYPVAQDPYTNHDHHQHQNQHHMNRSNNSNHYHHQQINVQTGNPNNNVLGASQQRSGYQHQTSHQHIQHHHPTQTSAGYASASREQQFHLPLNHSSTSNNSSNNQMSFVRTQHLMMPTMQQSQPSASLVSANSSLRSVDMGSPRSHELEGPFSPQMPVVNSGTGLVNQYHPSRHPPVSVHQSVVNPAHKHNPSMTPLSPLGTPLTPPTLHQQHHTQNGSTFSALSMDYETISNNSNSKPNTPMSGGHTSNVSLVSPVEAGKRSPESVSSRTSLPASQSSIVNSVPAPQSTTSFSSVTPNGGDHSNSTGNRRVKVVVKVIVERHLYVGDKFERVLSTSVMNNEVHESNYDDVAATKPVEVKGELAESPKVNNTDTVATPQEPVSLSTPPEASESNAILVSHDQPPVVPPKETPVAESISTPPTPLPTSPIPEELATREVASSSNSDSHPMHTSPQPHESIPAPPSSSSPPPSPSRAEYLAQLNHESESTSPTRVKSEYESEKEEEAVSVLLSLSGGENCSSVPVAESRDTNELVSSADGTSESGKSAALPLLLETPPTTNTTTDSPAPETPVAWQDKSLSSPFSIASGGHDGETPPTSTAALTQPTTAVEPLSHSQQRESHKSETDFESSDAVDAGCMTVGTQVFVKWRENKMFYAAKLTKKIKDVNPEKWEVRFDADQVTRTFFETEIIRMNRIERGQKCKFFVNADTDSVMDAKVLGHSIRDGELHFTLEYTDMKSFHQIERPAQDVYLTPEQAANYIRKETRPPKGASWFADGLDLTNIQYGSRSARSSRAPPAKVTASSGHNANEATHDMNLTSPSSGAKGKPRTATSKRPLSSDFYDCDSSSVSEFESGSRTLAKNAKLKPLSTSSTPICSPNSATGAIGAVKRQAPVPVTITQLDNESMTDSVPCSDASRDSDSVPVKSPEETAAAALMELVDNETDGIFSHLAFIVHLDENESRSEVGGSSSSVTYDPHLLKEKIVSAGGLVFDDVHTAKKQLGGSRRTIVLISDTYHRSKLYMLCLASGIPCIRYEWVINCCAAGAVADFKTHLLPSGYSAKKNNISAICSQKLKGNCLKDIKACVISENAPALIDEWREILSAAGVDLLPELPFSLAPNRKGNSDKYLALVAKDATNVVDEELVDRARLLKIPIVGMDYIEECLVNGRRITPEEFKRFQNSATASQPPTLH